MDNLPIKFFQKEQFGKVRVILKDGEPWFVAKDIAEALGYASNNMGSIFAAVPLEWKGRRQIATPNANQEMLTISEQGLYFFLGRSDKPAALPFQMWIAGEIMPSIRKTGTYSTPALPPALETKFHIAERFADRLYADKNQQILFLDKFYKVETGESMLELTGVTLIAPTARQLFTPTEIGKWYDMSAHTINNVLEDFGLQKRISDKWEPTDKGINYGAVMLDTGKVHSDGTPVRQLKWDSQIQNFLDQRLTNLEA